MDLSSIINATAWIMPVILAVTLHEAAHGWMAERFGDNTARSLGRVTFNPLKHIDRFGTIILPALLFIAHSPMLFGYAKPVPVNFNNLTPQRLGMLLVAFAGPGTNILLAFVSALLLHFGADTTPNQMSWWQLNLVNSLMINCALAIFNMMPVLPLDGGRVLRSLLPGEIGDKYARTERYGMLVVFGLILIPPLLHLTFVTDVLMFFNGLLIRGVLFAAGISS
jgi:Zn-dependent protease